MPPRFASKSIFHARIIHTEATGLALLLHTSSKGNLGNKVVLVGNMKLPPAASLLVLMV